MAHALQKSYLSKHAECGKPRNNLSFIRGAPFSYRAFSIIFSRDCVNAVAAGEGL